LAVLLLLLLTPLLGWAAFVATVGIAVGLAHVDANDDLSSYAGVMAKERDETRNCRKLDDVNCAGG
jgi:hypothetical protein